MKTLRRVFLAGKITGNEWRRELVHGELALHPQPQYDCLISQACCGEGLTFPVRERAVLSLLDYVGPYYVGMDEDACACPGEAHSHGAWHGQVKRAILEANMRALVACDVVFAWLDDSSAVGTVFEMGYAHALGKEVWVGG